MIHAKTDSLKTERLVLKAYEDSDQEKLIELLCNEEVKETFMIPDFATEAEAVNMFYKLKEFSVSDSHFEYGIYLEEQLIGFVNDVETDGDTIEIGYVIHPKQKNHGYATEALSAVIKELFRMGYSVVRAGFFSENIASKRVMEKSGMGKIEKTDDIAYHGKIHHCYYYEIRK